MILLLIVSKDFTEILFDFSVDCFRYNKQMEI